MKAVILAGGLGTRLRPVTYEIPKPLVPVKKRPIVNHLVHFFARHGVEDIAILASAAHREDFARWRKTWDDELPHEHITIFYEETPRGTFGGMNLVKDWIGSERFFLSNGDELKEFDLGKFRAFHEERGGVGSIALVSVPNPHEYGVPVTENGRVTEFLYKPKNPPSNFISSGLQLFEPEVFDYADFSREQVSYETDIFPKLASEGRLFGLELEGRWYDCGTIERWEKAMKEW